jgi:predicted helicase
MIGFYNSEVERWLHGNGNEIAPIDFVSNDKSKIKWTSDLLIDLGKGKTYSFNKSDISPILRRPFFRQYLYKNKAFNWTHHLMGDFFGNEETKNKAIYITGTGTAKDFTVLMTDMLPDFQLLSNGQALPLYLYEKTGDDIVDLFAEIPEAANENGYTRKDGIRDGGLAYFQQNYLTEEISKEDTFYYVYGLLHSPDYRQRFADNLSKELPRIPCVKAAEDFWHFSQAGRELAALHLDYETVEPFAATLDTSNRKLTELEAKDYYVTKMKHPKVKNEEGKSVNDLSTVIYNHAITVRDIPVEAYDYVVNGKPAIEWVIERQSVKTDKASGIVNDANDWAVETMNNPKYPLELLLRVITVSLATNKIVANLPDMVID